MTNMTLQAVRQLIADDSYAITFQSIGQYRANLLRHFDNLTEGPAATQQAAAPGALLAILLDVHDTMASQSDSDIDHFEDDDEEREGAPAQYAARKVMEVMDMLKAAAPSAPSTPEAPQTAAACDVLAERRRQVEKEGMTSAGDDGYQAAELPRAAAAYILNGANDEAPAIWPWAKSWWKPRDARANYVRAGALVLAEIERLDRAAQIDGGAA